MKNNDLDQFYTNPKVVDSLLDKLFSLFYSLQLDPNQYQFIEPSAGTGNFIDGLYKKGVNANHMDDGIRGADVAEEFIAQTFALAGTLDQTGNVHEFHNGRGGLLGVVDE